MLKRRYDHRPQSCPHRGSESSRMSCILAPDVAALQLAVHYFLWWGDPGFYLYHYENQWLDDAHHQLQLLHELYYACEYGSLSFPPLRQRLNSTVAFERVWGIG
mmetsp:Transcript_18646/g.18480  ORF Transcript_18646/g.18480 Transcript_18646/m.18480 type:complete len:104 (+) Transcript_18646:61-372(+)